MNDSAGTGDVVGPDPLRRDPLAGRSGWTEELLAELSPSELEEYTVYWTEKYEAARQVPGQGQRAWWLSTRVASGMAERSRRERAESPDGSSD